MELKNYFAQDAEGNAQPNATCYLYNADTTNLANGLVDADNQPLTNPFISNDYGLIQFKVPNGLYDLRVISGGRDYKIRVQAADASELIGGIADAVAAAEVATDAAADAQTKADLASTAATSATNARDASEAYAINVLSSVTAVDQDRIAAQQAALDAATSAASIGIYIPPVGPSLALKGYLDRNKLFAGNASEIQGAIDYANSIGGRDVTLLPNVIYDMGMSSITMKAGVELKSDTGHAVSVQHLATGNPKGLPVIKCGAITSDFIIVPSTAFNNVLRNLIIDARLQVSGDALKYSDAAGVQRTDSKAENILVYKHGLGSAIRISPNHKEGGFREVFARCGSGIALPGDGEYGLFCESIDWDFNRLLCGFGKTRSLMFTGGASRFRDVDAWGSQDVSCEIQGTSSTWDRLQVDGSGNSGLLINGGDDVVINKFISINNCLTASVPTDDVIIRGECRSLSLAQVRMRGTTGNIRYAIGMEDTAIAAGSIEGFNFASSYLDGLNDKGRAYIKVSGGSNALSPSRSAAPTPVVVNSNPLFTKFVTGVPYGWTLRGSATTSQITPSGITTGKYLSGVSIVSGSVGVSGIQLILDADEFKGRRIRCEGWFKGSGSTYSGNQRLQLFDGVNTFVETIPNDGQYHWIAIDAQMDITAANIQIRIVAANDTTSGIVLEATAVTVTAY